MDFQISLLEIDLLQRKGSFSTAYERIEQKTDDLRAEDSDVYQRIHMLVLEALLFVKIGEPSRGLTVAVQAAAVAQRVKLLPALWEAVGVLSSILSMLEEFEMARSLLEAIIPQVRWLGESKSTFHSQ